MSSMDDLVTWLRAQLDDDERAAREATPGPWTPDAAPDGRWYIDPGPGADDVGEATRRADAEHIARHNPARVLAEVERTRKLIRRHELVAGASTALVSFTRGQDDGYRQACEDAIRDAAEVYADRPGYREEWRP